VPQQDVKVVPDAAGGQGDGIACEAVKDHPDAAKCQGDAARDRPTTAEGEGNEV
jgi:hypothetical protein